MTSRPAKLKKESSDSLSVTTPAGAAGPADTPAGAGPYVDPDEIIGSTRAEKPTSGGAAGKARPGPSTGFVAGGTVAGAPRGVAAAGSTDEYGDQDREYYVFVDNSNLWIGGRQGDPRHRINFGALLGVCLGEREVVSMNLYGSRPPPNDGVWNSAKRAGFEVKLFEKSSSGSEKEVDTAIACDIGSLAADLRHEQKNKNATIVLFSGDRDMRPPVERAIACGVRVIICSFTASLAGDFVHMATSSHGMLTILTLDDYSSRFTFTTVESAPWRPVSVSHAAVIPTIVEGEVLEPFKNLLPRFYRRTSGDVTVVEFPDSDLGSSLAKLNRFLAQLGIPAAVTYDQHYAEEVPAGAAPALERTEELGPSDGDWEVVGAAKHRLSVDASRKALIACRFGIRCKLGGKCGNRHSDQEHRIFKSLRSTDINWTKWKSKLCDRKGEHDREMCSFAHSLSEVFCLNCRNEGHLSSQCPAPRLARR